MKLEKLPHFFENVRPQLFKNGRNFFSSNERPHFFKISYQMEYELDILANGRHPPRLKKQKQPKRNKSRFQQTFQATGPTQQPEIYGGY